MAEQAYAYVTLIPVAKGFQGAIAKEMAGVSNVGKQAGEGAGSRFTSGFGSVMKGLAVAGAAAVGVAAAGIGVAMNKGFDRLTNIENARNLLQGIGHDSQTVETVMGNALTAVRGTAFGLDEAAKVAAGAVAAGVEPGQDLERILGVVADTATVAGTSMEDIGSIMGKVTTSNRATNGELQQLAERGIPVYSMLADEAGVSADAIFDMASRGEISAEMLADALESNLGGAALNAGETTEGAFANLEASVSRVGANLLGPVFEQFAGFFTGLTEALGPVEEIASELGVTLGEAMAPVFESLVALVPQLVDAIVPLLPTLIELGVAMLDMVIQILPFLIDFIAALVPIFEALLPPIMDLLPIIMDLAVSLLPIFVRIIEALVPVIEAVAPIFLDIVEAMIPIVEDVLPIAAELFELLAPIILDLILAIAPLIEATLPILADILENFVVPALELLVDIIETVIGWFTDFDEHSAAFQEKTEEIADTLVGAWEGVKEWFGDLGDNIKDSVSTAGDWLKDTGQDIMDGLDEGATTAWSTAKGWWDETQTRVTDAVGVASDWLTETGNEIMEGMESGSNSTWTTSVSTWFGGRKDAVLSFFSDALNWLKNAGKDIIQGIRDGFTERWELAKTWLGERKDRILDSFRNAKNWLKDVGEDIINGLKDGLTGAWRAVRDWVNEKVGWIVDRFKDALDISSPSRVFEEIGKNIGEGLVLGMNSMEPAIESQVGMLLQVPDVERASERQDSSKTVHYYAAPNQSLTAEQELMKAMRRARLVANW